MSQASILKYFGAQANKILSYGVASVSGTVLAVCSCTVLPLFAGIYMRGAGIGPATAFLYSGPAINVLAIALTAKVLGWELGLARALGAVIFAILSGLIMAFLFSARTMPAARPGRSICPTRTARHASSGADDASIWQGLFDAKGFVAGALLVALAAMLQTWFAREELGPWVEATWGFMKQIFPLLLAGVLAAGFLLGRPGYPALIPEHVIVLLVGGNSLGASLFASLAGDLMYFATLTEVPILQGLIGSGMGKGPALSLLLAGPALSLPSMITLAGILGIKKTLASCAIVVVLSTTAGMAYGWLAP